VSTNFPAVQLIVGGISTQRSKSGTVDLNPLGQEKQRDDPFTEPSVITGANLPSVHVLQKLFPAKLAVPALQA
jgi:hypothetical protein